MKGNYTEAEMEDAMDKILQVLKKAKKVKWTTVNENTNTQTELSDQRKNEENNGWIPTNGMRNKGLRYKNDLIIPALEKLYYEGRIENTIINKKNCWRIKPHSVDRSDVLPATDYAKIDGAA